MSKFDSEEDEWIAAEFDNENDAREFARRWTRASLEELRRENQSKEDLKKQWSLFGDDAVVLGIGYSASSELDFFIKNPAKPEEIDWKTLKGKSLKK